MPHKKTILVFACLILLVTIFTAQINKEKPDRKKSSSYMPVIEEPLEEVMAKDKAQKSEIMERQMKLLNERYDLAKNVTSEVTMSKGKPLPVGPTARLNGLTWEQLAAMLPDAIKEKNIFPYLPLPHPNHPVGGMIFTQAQIKLLPRLKRFDLDFDLPDHFLPEFPSPIFFNNT